MIKKGKNRLQEKDTDRKYFIPYFWNEESFPISYSFNLLMDNFLQKKYEKKEKQEMIKKG